MKKLMLYCSCFMLLSASGCNNDDVSKNQNTSGKPDTLIQIKNPDTSFPVARKHDPVTADDISPAAEETGDIASIRKEYAKTQDALNAGTLRKETKEYECDGEPGGGKLLRYYDGKALVLMIHEFGAEHYWYSKKIFLKNGDPYFALNTEGSWGFGGPQSEDGMISNTIDKIKEDRFYIESGKVVLHLTKSFEEKSWEKPVKSEMVPNKTIAVRKGEQYPDMASIPKMQSGSVGCGY